MLGIDILISRKTYQLLKVRHHTNQVEKCYLILVRFIKFADRLKLVPIESFVIV